MGVRDWLKLRDKKAKVSFMDPVLGEITSRSDSFVSIVRFQGSEIELTIDPDGEDLELCLELARKIVEALEAIHAKAKSVASEKLLETYNVDWRFYSTVGDDGQSKEIEDPHLSASDFEQRLELAGIGVTGRSGVDFCFNDDGLFAGHSIFVTSFDGHKMNDVDASLFG